MNAHFFLAAAGGGGPINQVATTFGVDWQHLVAQSISFGIVCALLYRFAYQRVLAMLADRRNHIAQGLADAKNAKAELARTEVLRQEVLAEANAQATRLIQEAHAAAARVQERETQKAIAAAEEILVKARDAAVRERARMLAELKHELGRLVVQTTATVTGKVLTPDDQRRLAAETELQISA